MANAHTDCPMSGYRPPSTEPRGKWARAIHAKRRSDGISQTGAFELLGSRLGLGPKSRAAYVAIDLGLREPTEAEQRVLADWLGGYPADVAESGAGDTPPGLADLIGSISALVEEIRAARRERADLEERVLALELAARLRGSSPDGEDGEPAAPRSRVG